MTALVGGPILIDFGAGENLSVDRGVVTCGFFQCGHFFERRQTPRFARRLGKILHVRQGVCFAHQVGLARALAFLKTFACVTTKPTQTSVGVGSQTLGVDLPATEVTGGKVITATRFFDITFACAQHEQAAQSSQGGRTSIQSIHADISNGCSTESVPYVDSQGTDIAFMPQMAIHGHSVVDLPKIQAL
jgi:hypothetical protein